METPSPSIAASPVIKAVVLHQVFHLHAYNQEMDYDWANHSMTNYTAFGTSSVRGAGEWVNYACPNDDARFIEAPKENGKRVCWVYRNLNWRFPGGDSDVLENVLIELLESEEDIWLWIDGDEELLLEPHYNVDFRVEATLAANKALQRRRQTTCRFESRSDVEMRRRVQSKSPIVRLDRKSTRLNSSHLPTSRMPSSA